MNGLGNKFSAEQERVARNAAIENFAKRAEVLGRLPGTHTLGKEFQSSYGTKVPGIKAE